jgi:hypothetical protein
MQPYETPLCRVRDLELEANLLTGSNETYPVDPYDPEFD